MDSLTRKERGDKRKDREIEELREEVGKLKKQKSREDREVNISRERILRLEEDNAETLRMVNQERELSAILRSLVDRNKLLRADLQKKYDEEAGINAHWCRENNKQEMFWELKRYSADLDRVKAQRDKHLESIEGLKKQHEILKNMLTAKYPATRTQPEGPSMEQVITELNESTELRQEWREKCEEMSAGLQDSHRVCGMLESELDESTVLATQLSREGAGINRELRAVKKQLKDQKALTILLTETYGDDDLSEKKLKEIILPSGASAWTTVQLYEDRYLELSIEDRNYENTNRERNMSAVSRRAEVAIKERDVAIKERDELKKKLHQINQIVSVTAVDLTGDE